MAGGSNSMHESKDHLHEDFTHGMQETYRALESRMHQEVLRRNVLRVLRIWRSWFIFSDDFLNGLQVGLRNKVCLIQC